MTSRSGITIFAVLAIAVLLAAPALAETPVATATFKCQGGKSIEATFYASSVSLKLSDGRGLTVPQAMSASGARATPIRTRSAAHSSTNDFNRAKA